MTLHSPLVLPVHCGLCCLTACGLCRVARLCPGPTTSLSPSRRCVQDPDSNSSSAALRDAPVLAWGAGAIVAASSDWNAVAPLAESKSGTVFLVQPRGGDDTAVRDVTLLSASPQVRTLSAYVPFVCLLVVLLHSTRQISLGYSIRELHIAVTVPRCTNRALCAGRRCTHTPRFLVAWFEN